MDEQPLASYGLCLRGMVEADLDAIAALENQVTPHGWSRSIFQQSLKSNQCFILTGANYSSILGFCILQTVLDELHILNVCISPQHQRHGWGEVLLKTVIDDAVEKGVCDIHLEVRASNLAARNLYHKLGFNDVGIRKNYYSAKTQREDALQMCLSLQLLDFK